MTKEMSVSTLLTLLLSATMATASWAGGLTCLTGSDPSVAGDAAQIAALVDSIDGTCSCGSYDGSEGKTHKNYVDCAKGVITTAIGAAQLRDACKGTVTKYYKKSSCGYFASEGRHPCVKKSSSGKVSCSIKRAGKCLKTSCLGLTRCIRAADTNRDSLINAADTGGCFPEWELGPAQTLMAAGALEGLNNFPDEALARVPDVPDFRVLTWGSSLQGAGTYLLEGPSLDQLQNATFVMGPGAPGTYDSGYAGIGGVHRHTNGRLYGFYHAEEWDPQIAPDPTSGYPGWYGSVGAAVSDDHGLSWQKLGAAITSSTPKTYPGPPIQGLSSTPSAVADPTGHYLYVYYGAENGTVSMARADLHQGAPVPGQFFKYNAGQFSEPGIGGTEDQLANLPIYGAFLMQPHVVYSQYLRLYVMVFEVGDYLEMFQNYPVQRSGIYVAFSEDGITWSMPEQMLVEFVLHAPGKPLSWEGSIVWDDATGQEGWMAYGHRNAGEGAFYMVGNRITFQ